MNDKAWYKSDVDETVRELKSSVDGGLSSQEAFDRLKANGYNELQGKEGHTLFAMLVEQFKDFLILILIAASIVSIAVGEITDSIVIIAIVILNAVLGVVQESRAEKALEALKQMAAPTSKVLRDGKISVIASRELVAGDIVLLEAGDYVPADIRLLEAVNLKMEEASLTGESVPVEKDTSTIQEDVPLGDRKNIGFMSTIVTYGRGKGVVVSTGMATEIGKIAQMIEQTEEQETPLQKKLAEFGRILGFACLAICAIVFALGIFEGEPLLGMFMTAVSLAVAAIPEGLPAVVTIALALGMQRMIKKHAIVKKLHAVETLGSTTVICSDKTGTLTQNQMTVVKIFTGRNLYDVAGEGYAPQGSFSFNKEIIEAKTHTVLDFLLQGAALCNDAQLELSDKENNVWRIVGDPTEGALVVAAAKAGHDKTELNHRYARIQEIPFDSGRKMMTTFHKTNQNTVVAFVKGAPDILLKRCISINSDGQSRPLNEQDLEEIIENNGKMASQALRVLAVAYKEFSAMPEDIEPSAIEKDLTFIGLLGMIDPPRLEAKEAVKVCKASGIRPVMITGDYKTTAMAVAKELGIAQDETQIATGSELDALSSKQLQDLVGRVNVFARVSPTNKVAIVEALKARDQIVAMTGDGVNDAPALKKADIGVAMGITGTDVAKESADMVLTDDNFASIVAAVEEGRVIYSNIRKFVFFLLSCNLAEICIIFIAELANWAIPLLPIQLLWLNLVTDSFPALALGMEKKEPDVMSVPPRDPKEPIINRQMKWMFAVQSIVLTFSVLGVYKYALYVFHDDLLMARTYAFATLIIAELLLAYTIRSERCSVFKIGLFSNKCLNIGVGISFLLLLIVLYIPALQIVFKTAALEFENWDIILPFAILPFLAGEISKMFLESKKTGACPVDSMNHSG